MLWTLPGATAAEKLALAAAAGFRSVGFTSEPLRWSLAERATVRARLGELGLRPVTMTAIPAGGPGTPSPLVTGDRDSLLIELRRNVGIARELGIETLVLLAGNGVPGLTRDEQRRALVETSRAFAEVAEQSGVTLALEALNARIDHPGSFLTDAREAAALVAEVASPGLRLLFDCYHQEVESGDAADLLPSVLGRTAVVHLADHPGRREPGTGAIDWSRTLAPLAAGFAGEVTLECRLDGDARQALERARGRILAELRA